MLTSGKLMEPQKAVKSLIFGDEIEVYTCYDVARSIYIERIKNKIAKKSENNGERDRVE